MKLSGLHILLTYQCTYECEHCFVWGSPRQAGTLTLGQIEAVLDQARDAGVEWIYFEGGEPFLYYAILVEGVKLAAGMGFHVCAVSNAYWATTIADAEEWLKPLRALEDLTVSSDLYHCNECLSEQAQNAIAAAHWLDIPTGLISIAQPEGAEKDQGEAMYRGRAARDLAARAGRVDYRQFDSCPHEDLREPGRVHLDPLGNVHICQGITIGNVFHTSLKEICDRYDPEKHAVCGPLLHGGPLALVEEFGLPHEDKYADACHLCYMARLSLRERLPEVLRPDQMYGVNL